MRSSVRDHVLPRLHEFGGHVLETALTEEQEQQLRGALGEVDVA